MSVKLNFGSLNLNSAKRLRQSINSLFAHKKTGERKLQNEKLGEPERTNR